MTNDTVDSQLVQNILDEYAEKATPQYIEHANKFRNLERWTGDNPVMLVVDAAFSSTGLNYKNVVKPAAERFQREYVEKGDISNLADLQSLRYNSEYTEQFGVGRPELVWKIAETLVDDASDTENHLSILQSWAETADPNDATDQIRELSGVGLATFQYLRMISGVDTAKPDIQVKRFIETIENRRPEFRVAAGEPMERLNSCQWLASKTSYSMVEIDQIAWWLGTETTSLPSSH